MGRKRIHQQNRPEPDSMIVKVWKKNYNGRTMAVLTYEDGSRRTTTYARYVMGMPPPTHRVVHLNQDATDCRKENLMVVTGTAYGMRKLKDINRTRCPGETRFTNT